MGNRKNGLVSLVGIIVGLLTISLTAPVAGTTVTLYPTSDAYVMQASPSSNTGAYNNVVVGIENDGTYYMIYMKFDVSSIPVGAVINSASLTLWQLLGSAGTFNAEMSGVDGSWTEGGLTWNNSPPPALPMKYVGGGGTYTSTTINGLTEWIDDWVNQGVTNYGFRFHPGTATTGEFDAWFSREGTSTKRPKLVITYSVLPTVTTTSVSSIAWTTASSGGNVTSDGGASVTARGVCWNTSSNPTTANSKTTDGSGTGSFSSSLTGLSPNTTYYVRAYAINSVGTAYGNQVSFSTASVSTPSVTTVALSDITTATASSGGDVSSDGGAAVTARGVCWNTSSNPTTANSKTTDGSGTGSFSSSLTGLSPNTTYYVRAYATNSIGTAYGNQESFITSAAASGDAYEPDDSFATAKPISDGATQDRSIHVTGNKDYAIFTLSVPSNVVITTDGASGDTKIYLYTSGQSLIVSDNDGNGLFSRITRTGLAAGSYYVMVEEFLNDGTIAAYTLNLAVTTVAGDSDGDSLPDSWEITNFGNLNQNGSGDYDGDGACNLLEYLAGKNPNNSSDFNSFTDTDFDGLPDIWEFGYWNNLGQTGVTDFDGDGYTNSAEYTMGTNPKDPNSPAPPSSSSDDEKRMWYESGCCGTGAAAIAWPLLVGVWLTIRRRMPVGKV